MMDRAVSGERDAFGFPKPGAETDPLPLEVCVHGAPVPPPPPLAGQAAE